jgi:hypothetical protein
MTDLGPTVNEFLSFSVVKDSESREEEKKQRIAVRFGEIADSRKEIADSE